MRKEAAAVWGRFGDDAGLFTAQCFPQGRAGPERCWAQALRGSLSMWLGCRQEGMQGWPCAGLPICLLFRVSAGKNPSCVKWPLRSFPQQ